MQEFLKTSRAAERLEEMRSQLDKLAEHYDARAASGDNDPTTPAEANPVFAVEVGPVPVNTSVKHFAPAMAPECWSRYASGITIEMHERVTEEPGGWTGYGQELLKPLPGDGHLARLLTINNIMNFEMKEPSEAVPDGADLNFSLRESLDGVVTVDEGFFRARKHSFLGLNWTHIYGKKSVQLAVPTPHWFNAMVPGLLRGILRFWLWEYSMRFMLDPIDAKQAHHSAGEAAEAVLGHAFHTFEREFNASVAGMIKHVEQAAPSGS